MDQGDTMTSLSSAYLSVEADSYSTSSSFESTGKLDHKAGKSWHQLTNLQRICLVLLIIIKLVCILGCLYLFTCALELLSTGLRLIEADNPKTFLHSYFLYEHEVVGIMCGVVVTLVLQSSSTTAYILIELVAGNIIPLKPAIPMLMGANIGASLINTILTAAHARDKKKFQRAFATAVSHDMFNCLTTLVLLPVEILFGLLFNTSYIIVTELEISQRQMANPRLMKVITDPLTKFVVRVDTALLQKLWANGAQKPGGDIILKSGHIFANSGWSLAQIGICVLAISIVVVLLSLALMVVVFSSLLKGRIANCLRKNTGAKLPHCPRMTEYLAMLFGAVVTIIIQSSSAFTSLLPTLVAEKAITLKRAYSLTLGSNLGSSATALYSAFFTNDSHKFQDGLQLAFCYLLFNFFGIILFYPVACTRAPLKIAKKLGKTAGRYRWFAIVYIVGLFVVLPGTFLGLSYVGDMYVWITAGVILGFSVIVISINSLRVFPRFLPKFLHSWKWMPKCFRSLEFYDKKIKKCYCCRRKKKEKSQDPEETGKRSEAQDHEDTVKTSKSQVEIPAEDTAK